MQVLTDGVRQVCTEERKMRRCGWDTKVSTKDSPWQSTCGFCTWDTFGVGVNVPLSPSPNSPEFTWQKLPRCWATKRPFPESAHSLAFFPIRIKIRQLITQSSERQHLPEILSFLPIYFPAKLGCCVLHPTWGSDSLWSCILLRQDSLGTGLNDSREAR